MHKQNSHFLNADSTLLIRQLKEGRESAYEILFKEYYKILTVFANKYLVDLEASRELVQDLFVNLYEKRDNLEINSSLKSYLFRSVHNRCINQINALKIRKAADGLHLTDGLDAVAHETIPHLGEPRFPASE